MTQMVIYNDEMLARALEDIKTQFAQYGKLNIVYDKPSKARTLRQEGFVFAALINEITDYFLSCGFNVDKDDVRYKLYDDVSQVVPEMVIDKQLFGGRPRIKHISDMDRALMSKFIDGIFTVLDTSPLYAGLMLHPSTYYNWVFHLDSDEIKLAGQTNLLPERDMDYLRHVHNLPCAVCGIQHRSHAHHAKIPKYVSNSKKTPDWTAIPLCDKCHLEGAHTQGHEWLVDRLKWLPVSLEDFCRLNYIRWKNKQ